MLPPIDPTAGPIQPVLQRYRESARQRPNAKVMIHQPYGQVGGQVSDIEIQAAEILKERERLNEILAKHTGQSLDIIARETDRDKYYTAGEAKAFGLVDEVLQKPPTEKK